MADPRGTSIDERHRSFRRRFDRTCCRCRSTADLMSMTQNRLATGKKVNSALDNPTNFFTSASLQSRAGDLNALLDSMSNGIKTLEAADNGLTAITKTIESMQSTLRQARQDKSFKTASYTVPTTAIRHRRRRCLVLWRRRWHHACERQPGLDQPDDLGQLRPTARPATSSPSRTMACGTRRHHADQRRNRGSRLVTKINNAIQAADTARYRLNSDRPRRHQRDTVTVKLTSANAAATRLTVACRVTDQRCGGRRPRLGFGASASSLPRRRRPTGRRDQRQHQPDGQDPRLQRQRQAAHREPLDDGPDGDRRRPPVL